MKKKAIKTFITYSWAEGKEHKDWVLMLAKILRENFGVDILLDQYETSSSGKNVPGFMDMGLEKSEKVIIVCSPTYKEKADKREKGTGYEYSLISQELYESQNKDKKFIIILRNGDRENSKPAYLKALTDIDFRNDKNFSLSLNQLVREIYDEPRIKKPKLGPIPNFGKLDEMFDFSLERVQNVQKKKEINDAKRKILNSPQKINNILSGSFLEIKNFIESRIDEFNKRSDLKFKYIPSKIEYYYNFNLSVNDIFLYCFLNTQKKIIKLDQYDYIYNRVFDSVGSVRNGRLIRNIKHYNFTFDDDLNVMWGDNECNVLSNKQLAIEIINIFLDHVK